MRALLLPFIASCSLFLSGCSAVYSVHPLNTSEDAVEEPAFEGKWTGDETGKGDETLCIQKTDGTEYNLVVSSPSSKILALYRINLVRLNDQLFADMIFKSQLIDGTEPSVPLGTTFSHVIAKLEVSDHDLAYAGLDGDVIEKQNHDGLPPLEYLTTEDAMLLTGSTEDLRQYISVYGDRIFTSFSHYQRMPEDGPRTASVPCSLPTPPWFPSSEKASEH